jgi:uncharacterized protein (TIGR03083 family)
MVPLSPRYGDSPVIVMSGDPRDQLVPLSRQRRRLEGVLRALGPDDWTAASRCAGWSVQDVAAHLAGVNLFWAASIRAGLAGTPTQYLANFDPVTTPEQLLAGTRELPPSRVLEQFVSSNDELLGVLEGLDDLGWSSIAEAPPGHLPVRLVASHALWDSWVHERDIVLQLSATQPLHADEVRASLRYVCALTSSLGLLAGRPTVGSYGVDAQDPDACFTLAITDAVHVRDGAAPAGSPTLTGSAVDLTEALSTRVAFPCPPPVGWEPLIEGLATAFSPASS